MAIKTDTKREYRRYERRYITSGYVTSYTRELCSWSDGAGMTIFYHSRMRLVKHLLKVRPYAWRSLVAEALNDAAYVRRHLTGVSS